MVPLERATRISPKRRLRRMQRGEIEEAAGELPAKAGKATIAATVSADGTRKKAPSFDGAFGAGDEARTRYLHLGKVALYQMSYARNGASGRDRTGDTRIFSPLLYQLSYRGISSRCCSLINGDQEGTRTLDLRRDRPAF